MAKQKNKRNNNGFTLVELLIAIVILGIVVVPLLNTFVLSARLNAKAKRTLSATSVAQNILEGVKANSIEDLVYQFNHPEDVSKFNLLERSMVEGSIGEMLMPDLVEDEHYFSISGININTKNYDALVHISPVTYQTEGSSDKKYNEQETVSIAYPNVLQDASYIHERSLDESAVNSFEMLVEDYNEQIQNETKGNSNSNGKGKTNGNSKKEPIIFDKSKISRTINLTIDEIDTLDNKASVTVNYTYSYNDANINQIYSDEVEVYNNSSNTEPLRSIYLFYSPLYTSTNGNVKDTININNLDNLPVTVYVIKQENSEDVSYASLENDYKMNLNVVENSASGASYLELRSNLDKNIYYNDSIDGSLNQTNYSYNGNLYNYSDIKNILHFNNLTPTAKKNVIFDIKVAIYKSGAALNNYPEDEILLSIPGTMSY